MWATPASSISRAPQAVTSRPPTRIVPPATGRSPVIASISSDWPLPSMPAIATISPPRTAKLAPSTAVSPRSSTTLRSDTSRPSPPGAGEAPFSTRRSTSRPTMRFASPASSTSEVTTVPTERPRRSTVTRSEISSSSLSLCEMKTIEVPCSRSPLQHLEELTGLLRGEDRGRLVEDEDPRAAVESPQDLDALLLADADVGDARVRVDGQAVALGELAHPGDGRLLVEQPRARPRLGPEHEVLGDGHHRDRA